MEYIEIIAYIGEIVAILAITEGFWKVFTVENLKRIWVTYLIIAINIGLFILLNVRLDIADSWLLTGNEIIISGEYYRLFTFYFIETNLFHFITTTIILFSLGIQFELNFPRYLFLPIILVLGSLGGVFLMFFWPSYSHYDGLNFINWGLAGIVAVPLAKKNPRSLLFLLILPLNLLGNWAIDHYENLLEIFVFRGDRLIIFFLELMIFAIGFIMGLVFFSIYGIREKKSSLKIFEKKKSVPDYDFTSYMTNIDFVIKNRQETEWVNYSELSKYLERIKILKYNLIELSGKYEKQVGEKFKAKFEIIKDNLKYRSVYKYPDNSFQKLNQALTSTKYRLINHQTYIDGKGMQLNQGTWALTEAISDQEYEEIAKTFKAIMNEAIEEYNLVHKQKNV